MRSSNNNETYMPPVRCPQCGERQNRFSGRVGAEIQDFKKIDCMVCGRVFEMEEYQKLLSQAQAEMPPSL